MSVLKPGMIGIINYVLQDAQGKLLDQTQGEPMPYLHGYGNIIPGLEEALAGKKVGERVHAEIPPEKAYGVRIEKEPIRVHQSNFSKEDYAHLHKGAPLELESSAGEIVVVYVQEKKGAYVTLSRNHPLAGEVLTFDVEIVGIRAALPVEIDHGHPHGVDGTTGHH